ncbi:DegV family protein [Clostridium chauvoei]|uniref:DegV family protein n=2 Tax=Clostridium chauvoei TaxID=46867 RepID=A0ABD4RGK6_9CLOT|nr:DegV family protein [Clostridium chauvoei]ATD53846.1 fatty acid-binding protein DegV [Clostridium chauvoei]ATD58350.1 fatty acid-binding protein DegV [Clostridium chauvoei]MBX7280394.1 DegV family protein [Clostridium chauvoei]MBX7282879.1 DegV family protein [Clostridium chauvoei]MBX7285285.1 DegV family protein [Clostridium chauvoei]
MQKIAILTDSASDLSLETLKENNIHLFPLRILYSNEEFEDKISITPEEVYNRLSTEIPTTSLPSPKTSAKVLKDLEANGYTHVIAISVSSGLSGTFNAFRLALEEHPNLTSYVYDSKIIGFPQGVLVLEAARLVKEKKSYDEIIQELPRIRENITGYFTLDTLEYLKKGGRIGKLAGTIGQFLHLKPIITMDEHGVYHPYAKVRGRKQSLSKMIEVLKTHLDESKCKVWILQGGCMDEALLFAESVKALHNCEFMGITPVGAMVAVHSGPGMMGLAIEKV